MKNLFIVIVFIFCCHITVFSQNKNSYIRTGLGVHFLGTGDLLIPKLEMEYGKTLNHFLEMGLSWNTGYIPPDDFLGMNLGTLEAFTTHIDPSIYFNVASSQFFKFTLGTGASFMFIKEEILFFEPGSTEPLIGIQRRFTIGGNMILQSSFSLKENTDLIFRLISQPYLNGDISSGISVNLSFKL